MELEYTAHRSGRLSGFLRGELRLSAGLMNRLKWQNALCVNGRPVHTDFPVSPGDRITVRLEEPVPDYPPEHLPLRVIYEDEQLLVVDKPPGMLIHPSRHRNTGTLANRVLAYYQATGQLCAFHPVTRLDRDTFGLVLLAKNSHIHHLLNDSHMAGELEKTYEALVYGVPPVFSGRVDAPIARLPLPSLLRKIDPAGQSATTLYQVQTTGPGWSRLRLQAVTGRTHQLRLHCAYLGCPILGDPQYASGESAAFSRQLGFQTQQLCAVRLRLSHPVTGQDLIFCTQSGIMDPKLYLD